MAGRNSDEIRCSFCNKTQDQVRKMIAGPSGVYICDHCVEICADIVEEEFEDDAEAFAEGAKETSDFEGFAQGQGYTISEASFDGEGSASVPEALAKAADALDEGGVTDCIETDNGYYVAKVTSLFDQEATEEKKQTIISQRKQDKYDEVIKGWRKKGDISVEKSVWKKVDFNDLKVTLHTEDSEKSTDSAN